MFVSRRCESPFSAGPPPLLLLSPSSSPTSASHFPSKFRLTAACPRTHAPRRVRVCIFKQAAYTHTQRHEIHLSPFWVYLSIYLSTQPFTHPLSLRVAPRRLMRPCRSPLHATTTTTAKLKRICQLSPSSFCLLGADLLVVVLCWPQATAKSWRSTLHEFRSRYECDNK